MKIEEIIHVLKFKYHNNVLFGKAIDEETTRDRVLYGRTDVECTGIVTTCFASVEVIRKAYELGCNFIICHESIFWNHGDRTDWLQNNQIFRKKTQLLEEYGITVWRNHDYIHAGIPVGGEYADGIFYGLYNELGFLKNVQGNPGFSRYLSFPGETARGLAEEMVKKMNLNGTRIVGDPNTVLNKVMIPNHIMGRLDNQIIEKIEAEEIDCLIAMEITDYTVHEYIRDSAMLGHPRAIIMIGHFNLEEPGMKYMVGWLKEVIGDLPVSFVQSGDSCRYVTADM